MADIVQFLVTMQDMTSGPLQKIAQTGEQAFNKLQQAVKKLSGKADELKKSLKEVNDQLDKLGRKRSISVDGSEVKKLGREIDELLTKKSRLEKSDGISAGSAKPHGARPASDLISKLGESSLNALLSGGKYALQAGMARQTMQAQMQILPGKQNGDSLTGQLEEFSKNGLYGDAVFATGKVLAGSGLSPQRIMPAMRMIGDLAIGDSDYMNTLASALGGAAGNGHVSSNAISMMADAGFNPMQLLADITHKTAGQLQTDIERGKISVNDLMNAMAHATGPTGNRYNAMKKLQDTPTGKWNAFTNTIRELAAKIDTALLPALGFVADFLNGLASNADVMYSITTAVGAMTAAWMLYTAWIERAAIGEAIAGALAYWPLALVGAIVAAITYLCLKYESWGKSMSVIWQAIKNFTPGTIDLFKFMVEDIGNWFDRLGLHIQAFFENIGGMSGNFGRAMKLAFHGEFKAAGQVLTAPIETEAGKRLAKRTPGDMATFEAHRQTLSKLFDGGLLTQLDFSLKHPKDGKGFWQTMKDGLNSYMPGTDKAAADGGADTASGITGGGLRNLTINVAKFQDKTEIHTVGLKEGVKEVEELIRDMFLRITNSASAMVTAGGQ